MAVTKICVTPTDLAAFLEGRLTGEERERVVRHLNRCSDCFERYVGAARLLDAIEEEEASAFSAAYVDVVEQNLFHDDQSHLWGTWRSSMRMGEADEMLFQPSQMLNMGMEELSVRASAEKRRTLDLLEEAVAALSPEDQLIVKMQADGASISAIARTLHLEQKPLYRRLQRIYASLRSTLKSKGVRAEDLAGMDLEHESDEPEK